MRQTACILTVVAAALSACANPILKIDAPGDGKGLSWAIPAWRLFDIDNWSHYPDGARIEPVDA
ncbi:hypothetical protein [Rhodoferax sp. UBA5149]|uniref:hypothetical protein n=1 Tax=Rhodoferax sp. UBA5149 TaxID=1947379 RepID=UPI0025D8A3B8|nr:hypothetical protein [Rhodoferax sp. UBA5149]